MNTIMACSGCMSSFYVPFNTAKGAQVYLARLLFSFRRSGLVLRRGPKQDAVSPKSNGARERSDESDGDAVH